MFNLKLIKKLQSDIKERDKLINSYAADVKRLQKKQSDDIVKDCHSSEFVVDWSNCNFNPFSLERHGGEKEAYTIIGYFDKDNKVAEWKFYCSLEQHNKLAEEFRNAITKKNNSAVR